MIQLIFALGCDASPPPPKRNHRLYCHELLEQVPSDCLIMARHAFDSSDLDTAAFGFGIACRAGMEPACSAAIPLAYKGLGAARASEVVFNACILDRHATACRAYLELSGANPEIATPDLLAKANAVVAGKPDTD